MKVAMLLFMLFISSFQAHAESMLICSTLHYSEVKKKVETEGSYDKFKHCAVSCLLSLRCSPVEVMQLGVLKELGDILGPGNAEWEDLEADANGVKLVTSKKAKTDKQCFQGCHKLHSPTKNCMP